MESAPLTLAHDHARAASKATQSSDTTVAIDQHALAAGEFAKAASGTSSAEALRTLRLLEQHHKRLSELLRYPSEHPVTNPSPGAEVKATAEKSVSTSAAVAELRSSKSDLGPPSPHRNPPGLGPRHLPSRDLTSSIASNLATARGIRGKYTRPPPLSPSVSTHQAPGSLETHRRRNPPNSPSKHTKPSWIPPTSQKSAPKPSTSRMHAVAGAPSPAAAAQDEGFSKFYSAFENILYKISAPLAFAGLPLATDDGHKPLAPEASAPKAAPRPDSESSEPDLSKFISRAALRASGRDSHAVNDSFYVVPTAGGTVSYARILSFAEKEKRRLASSMHSENADLFPNPDEEDDFVDARETFAPVSPKISRDSNFKGKQQSERELKNKIEELAMENTSLKDCVDKLAKRLQAFEMSAQQNSIALQESMRLIRDKSPADDRGHGTSLGPREPPRDGESGRELSDDKLNSRVAELERDARHGRKEIARLSKENEKLNIVVARYREKWEKLKEGARGRRDPTGPSGGGKEGGVGDNGNAKKDADPVGGRFLAG